MFLIDDWYYHFVSNACSWWSRNLDLTRKYFYVSDPNDNA